jgi:hypothetical protein
MWALHVGFIAEEVVPVAPAPVVAEAWRPHTNPPFERSPAPRVNGSQSRPSELAPPSTASPKSMTIIGGDMSEGT